MCSTQRNGSVCPGGRPPGPGAGEAGPAAGGCSPSRRSARSGDRGVPGGRPPGPGAGEAGPAAGGCSPSRRSARSGDRGAPGGRPPGQKTVIGRAALLLDCLAAGDSPGISELARRSGLAKTTVFRLVHELASCGLVEVTGDGVRLGMWLFELGSSVPRQRSLAEAALPYMRDLQQATGDTVHLAVLDRAEVVYLQILRGRGTRQLPSRVGGRMPAHATGVGKAILAFSPPEVVSAVITGGLARRTARTIVAPGVLRRELSRVRQAWHVIRPRGVRARHRLRSQPGIRRGWRRPGWPVADRVECPAQPGPGRPGGPHSGPRLVPSAGRPRGPLPFMIVARRRVMRQKVTVITGCAAGFG